MSSRGVGAEAGRAGEIKIKRARPRRGSVEHLYYYDTQLCLLTMILLYFGLDPCRGSESEGANGSQVVCRQNVLLNAVLHNAGQDCRK